jgi:hypothetical protein
MKSIPLIPNVQNLTLTSSGTEYSLSLSPGCEFFTVQCRTSAAIRFAFVTGKVAAPTDPVFTIPAGGSYSSPQKYRLKTATTGGQTATGSQTIYFAGGTNGLVVELIEWTQ